MLRDAAVAIIKQRCGRLNLATVDADIVTEMDLIITTNLEKAQNLPWFLIKDDKSFGNTTNATETLALPSDFLRPAEGRGVFRQDTALNDPWVPVIREPYDTIIKTYKDEVAAPPVRYDILESSLYFRPIPDATIAIRLIYFATAASIASANVTNAWLTHAADLVIAETGVVIAEAYLQNDKMAQRFMRQAAIARDRVNKETLARLDADTYYTMGDD